jgi:cysteine desulfurase/selenocysteine lyase
MSEPVSKSEILPTEDLGHCRADFPTLAQQVNGQRLVYLDSAASSQAPSAVIDAIGHYQRFDHANVHRGVHTLSHRATDAFEGARKRIAEFINAKSANEVIFTRGTTEAINLVAQSHARPSLKRGDRILITHLEHHSNIVPWQMVCQETGAELLVAPIDERGEVIMDEFFAMLDERVRIVAVAHVSNALGTVLPVDEIVRRAHALEIPVLVDGAQAVPHMTVDMQALGCDFYAFSGHKMLGPTGIGVLYGTESMLDAMPPWQGGGDMILEVRFDGTSFNELPYKFEAGTPNISGAVGLGAAVDYLAKIGMERIARHEKRVLDYLMSELQKIEGMRLFGTATGKASVQSFAVGDIHAHDLGTILDHKGVAIRTGHHCAMPVMDYFGIPGTARASLALYNDTDDIDQLVDAITAARTIFG